MDKPLFYLQRDKQHLSFAQKRCIGLTGKRMQISGMLYPGARIGIALSGGTDSFLLAEVLRRRQRIVPFPFEIMVLHLNPGFDPDIHRPLTEWVKKNGLTSHIEVTDHGLRAHSSENRKKSACFFCAMLRRTRLFELCAFYKLTHLAFGHTLDDLTTTFFMNLLKNGRVDGLTGREAYFGGQLEVIRPIIDLEKSVVRRAVSKWNLPVFNNPCPSAGKTFRADIENTITQLCGKDKLKRQSIYGALSRWQLDVDLRKN